MRDAPADRVTQVTPEHPLVRADHRLIPVHEARIARAAYPLIGALVGLSHVEPIAAIIRREIAPDLNRLVGELRDAGWVVPPPAPLPTEEQQ